MQENILSVTNCHIRIILYNFLPGYQCAFSPHFALNPQILQAIKKRKRFFDLNPVFYLTVLLKFCSVSLFSQVEEISFSFDGVTNVNQLSVRAQHRRTRGHQHCSLWFLFFGKKKGKSKEVEIWEQMQLIQILMLQLIFAKGKWILKYQVPCFTMDICT